MQFISDVLREDMFVRGKLNFIISGCGSGKSYWAAHCGEFFSGILPSQILMVTSRALTTRQQARDYNDNMKSFYIEHADGEEILYWNGDADRMPDGHDLIHIMSIHAFAELLASGESSRGDLSNIKVLIFDEVHALVADRSFMKRQVDMAVLAMKFMLARPDVLCICMTATKEILFYGDTSSIRNLPIHNVLPTPIFRYHVQKLTVCDSARAEAIMMAATPEHRVLCMCNQTDMIDKLTVGHKERISLSSKDNKKLNDDSMEYTRRIIVEEEDFPHTFTDPDTGEVTQITTLIGTSTIREGVNFCKDCAADTVICYDSDPMNIIQLVGRCRYDVDHLVIVYTGITHGKPGEYYFDKAMEMREFVYKNNDSWVNNFINILADGAVIENLVTPLESYKTEFYQYMSGYIDKPIIRKELRDIIEKAKETNAFAISKRKLTLDKFKEVIGRDGYVVEEIKRDAENHRDTDKYLITRRIA